MVSMYRHPSDSPRTLRSIETFLASVTSSTNVSGQTRRSNSSLSTILPLCSIRTARVSNAFGVSGIYAPSLNSILALRSNRKGPKSYNCLSEASIRIATNRFEMNATTSSPAILQDPVKTSPRLKAQHEFQCIGDQEVSREVAPMSKQVRAFHAVARIAVALAGAALAYGQGFGT